MPGAVENTAQPATYTTGSTSVFTTSSAGVYVVPSASVYLYPSSASTGSIIYTQPGGANGAFAAAQMRIETPPGTFPVTSYTPVSAHIMLREALASPAALRLRGPRPVPRLTRAAVRERDRLARRALRVERRADMKAETTLLKLMSRAQRLTWINGRFFDVQVESRTYRIREGLVGNVVLLDAEGKPHKRLCCHPDMDVPLADVALAQWMMLAHNEAGFLQMANVLPLRHPYTLPNIPDVPFERETRIARAAGF